MGIVRKRTPKKLDKIADPIVQIKKFDGVEQCDTPPPLGCVTGTNIPRTRQNVAIVGFAPGSMTQVRAFFDDPNWEIWGINQLYITFPMMAEKATRWFQIHRRESYERNVDRDHSHHAWLQNQRKFPIYMEEQQPDVPMSVAMPWQALIEKFGSYFTNSISWEIALAVHEGFKRIALYGIDMAQDNEYTYERPSVEYFLGWARGSGIEVIIPAESDLLKTMWIYPLENSNPFRERIEGRMRELRQRINQHAAAEQEAHDARMQLLGAEDNMSYIRRAWENSATELAVQERMIAEALKKK